MRLSRIWRTLWVKEGVIHRGRRQNSSLSHESRIQYLLLYYSFKICFVDFLEFSLSLSLSTNWAVVSLLKLLNLLTVIIWVTKITHSHAQFFFVQRFNNLQWTALLMSFWCHRLNNLQRAVLLKPLIQYDGASFQIWWTADGYDELCMWFQPIKNGELFWTNDNKHYLSAPKYCKK